MANKSTQHRIRRYFHSAGVRPLCTFCKKSAAGIKINSCQIVEYKLFTELSGKSPSHIEQSRQSSQHHGSAVSSMQTRCALRFLHQEHETFLGGGSSGNSALKPLPHILQNAKENLEYLICIYKITAYDLSQVFQVFSPLNNQMGRKPAFVL